MTDAIASSAIPDITAAIVERLRDRLHADPALPMAPVEDYPDDPKGFKLTGNAALLVAYGGSDYGALGQGRADYGLMGATDAAVRERFAEWHVNVIARGLKGPTGAVTLMEAARLILAGFTPPGCTTPLVPARDGFVAQGEGKWVFKLVMMATSLAVPLADDEQADLITRLVWEWDGNTTVEVSRG